jgi:hypothetical protein
MPVQDTPPCKAILPTLRFLMAESPQLFANQNGSLLPWCKQCCTLAKTKSVRVAACNFRPARWFFRLSFLSTLRVKV